MEWLLKGGPDHPSILSSTRPRLAPSGCAAQQSNTDQLHTVDQLAAGQIVADDAAEFEQAIHDGLEHGPNNYKDTKL
jgi:hypothetical protein